MPKIGYKFSEESKKKMSVSHMGKPSGRKGKSHTPEAREKIREAKLSLFRDKTRHPMWKGGISRDIHGGKENIIWRSKIFERDNWTCQTCWKRGVYLEAHHIKSWARYPELRFELTNGVSLCVGCHRLTDNYKGRGHKK